MAAFYNAGRFGAVCAFHGGFYIKTMFFRRHFQPYFALRHQLFGACHQRFIRAGQNFHLQVRTGNQQPHGRRQQIAFLAVRIGDSHPAAVFISARVQPEYSFGGGLPQQLRHIGAA